MINSHDIEDMIPYQKAYELSVGDHFKFVNAPSNIYKVVSISEDRHSISYEVPVIGKVYVAWSWEFVIKVPNEEV